jgi:hypothetical protein
VFLYCKSLLRPEAPGPPQELLEIIDVEETPPMPPSGGSGIHRGSPYGQTVTGGGAAGGEPGAEKGEENSGARGGVHYGQTVIGGGTHATHPLDLAPSPLIRALPDYERQFRHQRQRAGGALLVWEMTFPGAVCLPD